MKVSIKGVHNPYYKRGKKIKNVLINDIFSSSLITSYSAVPALEITHS